MPLYEYECDACGRRFELIQKFSDAHAETCTACGSGPVRRLLSSPAIQFKGTGWYITDYAKKGKTESPSGTDAAGKTAPAESGSKEAGSTPPASSETSSTPAKTETKSGAKDSAR
jgi:putative FmdB family regulatory protein